MKRHPCLSVVAMLLAQGAGAVLACSDSAPQPGASTDTEDATTLDASHDGAPAGDADARIRRTCSEDNFCPTALPLRRTLRGVWGDGDVVWSVTEEGDVFRWNGSVWLVHASKLGALYGIWGSSGTDLWIGGANGLYHGKGSSPELLAFSHEDIPSDDTLTIRAIWGTGGGDVWAAGGSPPGALEDGRILHYLGPVEAGSGWRREPIANYPFVFFRVWGTAAGDVWIVGGAGDLETAGYNSGELLHRAPGASTFARTPVEGFSPKSSAPVKASSVVAGGMGSDGSILLFGRSYTQGVGQWHGTPSGDGAYRWSYRDRDDTQPGILAVWGASPSALWAAGYHGLLRRWDGKSWTPARTKLEDDILLSESLYGIWGKSAEDFWVVGRQTALHHLPRQGGAP